MEYSCCFTGHRPNALPFKYNENDPRCIELKRQLRFHITRLVTENNVKRFITGMAMGVDIFAAEEVLKAKQIFHQIELVCAIPCPNQTDGWNSAWKQRYQNIIDNCTESVVLSREYNRACMHIRNRYMVDNAKYLIAVFGGGGGGTASTIRYANKKEREITVIDPSSL